MYSDETADALCKVLSSLLRRDAAVGAPRALIAHTSERWGACGYDAALLSALRSHGLHATPIAGPAIGVADDAPIEQRGVILEIVAAEQRGVSGASDEAPQEEDAEAARVLLRATRAQALLDAAERAAMTEEELAAVATAAAFSEQWL